MCTCDSSDGPEFMTTRYLVARKAHKCIECGKRVKIGQKYQRVAGVWDKEFDSFATCLHCAALRNAFEYFEGDCIPAFSTLYECVKECFGPQYSWAARGPDLSTSHMRELIDRKRFEKLILEGKVVFASAVQYSSNYEVYDANGSYVRKYQ